MSLASQYAAKADKIIRANGNFSAGALEIAIHDALPKGYLAREAIGEVHRRETILWRAKNRAERKRASDATRKHTGEIDRRVLIDYPGGGHFHATKGRRG